MENLVPVGLRKHARPEGCSAGNGRALSSRSEKSGRGRRGGWSRGGCPSTEVDFRVDGGLGRIRESPPSDEVPRWDRETRAGDNTKSKESERRVRMGTRDKKAGRAMQEQGRREGKLSTRRAGLWRQRFRFGTGAVTVPTRDHVAHRGFGPYLRLPTGVGLNDCSRLDVDLGRMQRGTGIVSITSTRGKSHAVWSIRLYR